MTPSADEHALIDRYRTLLDVSRSIVAHHDLSKLFDDLKAYLPRVVSFDSMRLILHDPSTNTMRVHLLDAPEGTAAPGDLETAIEESPAGWVWLTQQPLVVDEVANAKPFPGAQETVRGLGIGSYCMLPLTTAWRRLGAIGFGSVQTAAFSDPDLEFLQQVATQVAVAVDNALNYQQAQASQGLLERERDQLRLLLEVNNAIVSHLDVKDLFGAMTTCLRRVMPHEYTSLALYESDGDRFRLHALDFPDSRGLIQEGRTGPVDGSPAGLAFRRRQPVVCDEVDLKRYRTEIVRLLLDEGVKSLCCVPLLAHDRALGTLNVARRRDQAFSANDVDLLGHVSQQIAIAVENAIAYLEIADLKDQLTKEKLYLEDEILTEHNFGDIVGESPLLKRVLKQVEIVAPTDSTVLIQGETGTGKELIARALHHLSDRREHTFVKMNCAAIPTGLLESELFGHERGAFTGAIAQKIGRFELAHRGTLFLDEVGDIPVELQSKLLRVLQEQEFERLGGTRTLRVDVRLIAATNRDLGRMVADKQFRNDLYYRLNVFPILLPPLRKRPEDIPVLLRYFAQKYARQMKKRVDTIPSDAMHALTHYPWPGNVRELENFIERAVILSPGRDLRIPLAELKRGREAEIPVSATLEDAEREHILTVLKQTNWVIGGPGGAAIRLGLKRTTLQSRMQKLGIARRP